MQVFNALVTGKPLVARGRQGSGPAVVSAAHGNAAQKLISGLASPVRQQTAPGLDLPSEQPQRDSHLPAAKRQRLGEAQHLEPPVPDAAGGWPHDADLIPPLPPATPPPPPEPEQEEGELADDMDVSSLADSEHIYSNADVADDARAGSRPGSADAEDFLPFGASPSPEPQPPLPSNPEWAPTANGHHSFTSDSNSMNTAAAVFAAAALRVRASLEHSSDTELLPGLNDTEAGKVQANSSGGDLRHVTADARAAAEEDHRPQSSHPAHYGPGTAISKDTINAALEKCRAAIIGQGRGREAVLPAWMTNAGPPAAPETGRGRPATLPAKLTKLRELPANLPCGLPTGPSAGHSAAQGFGRGKAATLPAWMANPSFTAGPLRSPPAGFAAPSIGRGRETILPAWMANPTFSAGPLRGPPAGFAAPSIGREREATLPACIPNAGANSLQRLPSQGRLDKYRRLGSRWQQTGDDSASGSGQPKQDCQPSQQGLPDQAPAVRTNGVVHQEAINSMTTAPDQECSIATIQGSNLVKQEAASSSRNGSPDQQAAAARGSAVPDQEEASTSGRSNGGRVSHAAFQDEFCGALLRQGRLCLVLDLDHTLVNSAKFTEVTRQHTEACRIFLLQKTVVFEQIENKMLISSDKYSV